MPSAAVETAEAAMNVRPQLAAQRRQASDCAAEHLHYGSAGLASPQLLASSMGDD